MTWILFLNDMRSPKVEIRVPVLRADSKQAILDFMAAERVESYREERDDGRYSGNWGKSYRKGGLLEWYNPPYEYEIDEHFVDLEEQIRQRILEVEEQLLRLKRRYLDELPKIP